MVTLFDILNGVRFALCLSLVFVFGWYLYLNRESIPKMRFNMDRIQAAVAFFIYELGEAGWRGFVWWNHGDLRGVGLSSLWYSVAVVSGTLAAVGSICCLRVLLPNLWAWPTWATIAILVIVVCLFSLS